MTEAVPRCWRSPASRSRGTHPGDRGPLPAARPAGRIASTWRRSATATPGCAATGGIGPAGDPRSRARPDRRGGTLGRVLRPGGAVARAGPGAIRADPRVAGDRAVPPDDAPGLPRRALDRFRPAATPARRARPSSWATRTAEPSTGRVDLDDLKRGAGESGRPATTPADRPTSAPSPMPRSTPTARAPA